MNTPQLCMAVARAWAKRHGHSSILYERPDASERQHPAVDLLGRGLDGAPRLVLEHTLVESFLDQRSVVIAAIKMLASLEGELSGKLPCPGHYILTLKPSSVLGLKRETERIRTWVAMWVCETAPSLLLGRPETAPGHYSTVRVPDTALEITLSRLPGRDGDFSLAFEAPPESTSILTPSLQKAIAAKCPNSPPPR